MNEMRAKGIHHVGMRPCHFAETTMLCCHTRLAEHWTKQAPLLSRKRGLFAYSGETSGSVSPEGPGFFSSLRILWK